MTKQLYSPGQVIWGAFLGGPIAAVYFLQANFRVLGKENATRNTVFIGGALVLALVVTWAAIPEGVPGFLIPALYIAAAAIINKHYQLDKKTVLELPDYEFYRHRRAIGVAVFALLAFYAFLALYTYLMVVTGYMALEDIQPE